MVRTCEPFLFEQALNGGLDVLLGDRGLNGFLQGQSRGIDAFHMGEACIEQLLTIPDTTCNQGHGHLMTLGTLKNPEGQLAHQRLSIGRTLACDNK